MLKERIKKVLSELQESRGSKKQFLNEESCKRNFLSLHKEIKQHQSDNNLIVSKFAELVYLIVNDIEKHHCKMCSNPVTFKTYDIGYIQYCSRVCNNKDPEYKLKLVEGTKKGVFEKYGVENISQLDSIKKQKEETMMKHYKVKFNSQRKEIKKELAEMMRSPEQIEKIKQGLIKSIGVSNPSLNKDVVERRQLTFVKNRIIRLTKYAKELNYEFLEFNSYGDISFKCNKGHDFKIKYQFFHLRMKRNECVCTLCNVPPIIGTSRYESELVDFIKLHYNGKILSNSYNILGDNKEIDVFLPELNIGFEINGVYWHGELQKHKTYHIDKSLNAVNKNIKLIHIYEDDWLNKIKIIKSRILSIIKVFDKKIYARECKIKIVDFKESKMFLIENHLQGNGNSAIINLGLYNNEELVSIMTFGKRTNIEENDIELIRYCNKLNISVIGGASKLFNYFIENYSKDYENVISFCDISWNNFHETTIYNKLGFEYSGYTNPNFWWIVNDKKVNRMTCTKEKLIENDLLLEGETIVDCMHRNNWYRLYDSGSFKFRYKINK